jgi:hypothetical protein
LLASIVCENYAAENKKAAAGPPQSNVLLSRNSLLQKERFVQKKEQLM